MNKAVPTVYKLPFWNAKYVTKLFSFHHKHPFT